MAWMKIDDTKLTAIADAIRGKTGKTAALTLDAMPTEIAAIETGGGASGEIDITADGTYDVSKYATANVDVVSLGTRSITANGTYDVTKYASANVNVQSAPVLLWTNASPTSNFAAQTVSVPTGYDGYLIEAKNYSGSDFLTITYAKNGVETMVSAPDSINYLEGDGAYRVVTPSDGSIVFSTGVLYGYNNPQPFWAIPTRIWGVKFTL